MASIASRYARAFAEVVIDMKVEPGQALRDLNDMAALLIPSAFNLPANIRVDDTNGLMRGMVYYSFITLTTLNLAFISFLVSCARSPSKTLKKPCPPFLSSSSRFSILLG
jgi:hypothetical protein